MNRTPIEWTDFSANPLRFRAPDGRVVWACEKLSPGCAHCYAASLADRYTQRRAGDWNAAVMKTLTPFLDEVELRRMLTHTPASGKRVFIGDMTDIFGAWVDDDLLDQLFAVLALRGSVTWQLLTKRANRMHAYFTSSGRFGRIVAAAIRFASRIDGLPEGGLLQVAFELEELCRAGKYWPLPNVWLGVSCEDQQRADERIPHLLRIPAAVRFISAEPLLGPINFDNGEFSWLSCTSTLTSDAYEAMTAEQRRHHDDVAGDCCESWVMLGEHYHGIDWVIVGGESGGGARRCSAQWVRALVRQCKRAGVPIFVKQLGGFVIDRNDAGFEGVDPREWPVVIAEEDRIEYDIDGYRTEFQGADVRIRLRDRKGGDPLEWPAGLRVREFPRSAVPV